MTERPPSAAIAPSGRLALTRLATRVSMMVERLAVAAAACDRRQPVPQRLLARPLLAVAGHGAPGRCRRLRHRGTGRALSAALLPHARRRRDRPPHRGGQSLAAQPGAGADRPAERQGKQLLAGAVARTPEAHGRNSSTASAPTCRARACRSATPGGCARWRHFCWSPPLPSPSGRPAAGSSDGFNAHGAHRCRAAAHRRLGDAAGLYRQAADLPDRRRQPGDADLHRSRRQRRLAARHRRLGRGNAGLCRQGRQCPRHRPGRTAGRRHGQAGGKPGDAVQGAPVHRQADRRRHADAEVGRRRARPLGLRGRSRTSRRRSASSASPSAPPTAPSNSTTRSTTTMAPPPPRRFSRWPIRRRRMRIRSMARPRCRCRCRAAAASRMPPRRRRT